MASTPSASERVTSTAGYASWYSRSRPRWSIFPAVSVSEPMRSRPRTGPSNEAISACISWTAWSTRRAQATKVWPDWVSRTLRLVRSKSRAPTSRSSWVIWWLSPDCPMRQRAAARVKLSSSAMATAYSICRRSIAFSDHFVRVSVLDADCVPQT